MKRPIDFAAGPHATHGARISAQVPSFAPLLEPEFDSLCISFENCANRVLCRQPCTNRTASGSRSAVTRWCPVIRDIFVDWVLTQCNNRCQRTAADAAGLVRRAHVRVQTKRCGISPRRLLDAESFLDFAAPAGHGDLFLAQCDNVLQPADSRASGNRRCQDLYEPNRSQDAA